MRKMIVAAVAAAMAMALAVPAVAAGHETAEVTVEHRINGVAAGAKLLGDPKALGKEATVDVYVNGALTLPGFEFGDVAGPLTLPAGSYDIVVKVGELPIITETVSVSGGDDVRLVARFGKGGGPTLGIR